MSSKCAACGKVGDNLKVCTSCEQVSYCNAKCRNSHRSKHKKVCRQLAAERHNEETAVSSIDVHAIIEKFSSIVISDEELFAEPPPREDCEICMLPMPHSSVACCGVRTNYQRCCGKTICSGCVMAAVEGMKEGNLKRWCPYCRAPIDITDKEFMRQIKKRIALNDAEAFMMMGLAYIKGKRGLPQDHRKAFELFNRGAELGSIRAHYTLAMSYEQGVFIEKDMGKAINHYKSAAIRGHEGAKYNLGIIEEQKGSFVQAFQHFMMAARSGEEDSLKKVGEGYKAGHVTKDEYASTLRAHRDTRDEMKSEQRTKAWEMMAKRDSSFWQSS